MMVKSDEIQPVSCAIDVLHGTIKTDKSNGSQKPKTITKRNN